MQAPTEPDARARILGAARAVFAAHGFQGASVRTIASDADVTAAMINYYFRSKEALYAGVVEDALSVLVARLGAAFRDEGAAHDGGDPLPVTPRAALAERLALAYFDFLAEERELQRLVAREMFERDARLPSLVARLVGPLRARLLPTALTDVDAQRVVSLFGAIAGYFLYAPFIGEIFAADPLGQDALEARRRHIGQLIQTIWSPDRP